MSQPSVEDPDSFLNVAGLALSLPFNQPSPLDVILAKVFTLLAQYSRTETLWSGFAEPFEGADGGKRTMIHDESMNTVI